MAKHDRRKTSGQPPRSQPVTIQVPLPVLGVINGVRESFHGLCIATGLQVLEAMMEADRDALCGPKGRHQVERPAWRGGSVDSQVTLGGRQVEVPRLRVRSAEGEVPLASFQWAASTDPLDEHTLAAVSAGVSTRRYASMLDPVPAEVNERATSSSAVSRRFVALSTKRLHAWRGSRRPRPARHPADVEPARRGTMRRWSARMSIGVVKGHVPLLEPIPEESGLPEETRQALEDHLRLGRVVGVTGRAPQLPVLVPDGHFGLHQPAAEGFTHDGLEAHLVELGGIRGDLFEMALHHVEGQLVGELERLDRGGSKVQLERGVARREVGAVVLDRFLQLGNRIIERRQVESHDMMHVRQSSGQ